MPKGKNQPSSTQAIIQERLRQSIELKEKVLSLFPALIEEAVQEIVRRLRAGGRVFSCGNGGSACDAQHLTGELVGRFYKNRPALPAMTLETNLAIVTAVGNDFSFDESFSRSAAALMGAEDVLIGISTSGNSANVMRAMDVARKKGAWVLGFSGSTGGKMAALCDLIFKVPSDDTPRIQEVHITVAHILCELIEREMFPGD